MPNIGGIPVSAGDEMSAADNARTQARANAEIHKIPKILAGAKVVLTERAQVRILLNPDRRGIRQPAEAVGDLFGKVHLGPSEVDGIIDLAMLRVHFAGRTNPDPRHLRGALLREVYDLLCDPVEDSLGSLFGKRKHL